MSRNYYEIIDDLKRGALSGALAARAAKAIDELLTMHEIDQSEIVRLRRMVEVLQMTEEEKAEDLREGNRAPYRRKT